MQLGLVSVNVAQPGLIGAFRGKPITSAIGKQPVLAEWIALDGTNLAGDRQADLSVHGGPDKAVYAYPMEHIRAWSEELGQDLGPGAFGENLTTKGALETEVGIGDIWAWGDARLQVSQPRQPCFKLATFRGRPDLPKKLVANGRTGWYLRVLQPARVPVAGPLQLFEPHPAAISVLAVHRARLFGQGTPEQLDAMVGLDALTASWREEIEVLLGRRSQ
jgi:MOSC domain-containing protein YiiM